MFEFEIKNDYMDFFMLKNLHTENLNKVSCVHIHK